MTRKKNNMQIESSYPSIYWEKFFKQFEEINILSIDKWTLTHIIGYFCQKYKNNYKIDYTFKFNSSAPSKSYEIYQMKRLSNMLSSSPFILKDYIDWWFQTKIIEKKKRITSMAFLTDANIVNEYKFKKVLIEHQNTIERTTVLPQSYITVLCKYNCKFTTYGELAFIKNNEKYKNIFIDLVNSGFNVACLDRVK